MATLETRITNGLIAPWLDWERRCGKGRRLLEAGTYALTEGAIAAGCRVFAGYPITPATDIAEYMSKRLPQAGGNNMKCETDLAGMTASRGPGPGASRPWPRPPGPGTTRSTTLTGWSTTTRTPWVAVN